MLGELVPELRSFCDYSGVSLKKSTFLFCLLYRRSEAAASCRSRISSTRNS
jgi:hypothetical protein